MGIAGSVTSAVSSTSVSLPTNKLTVVGVGVYGHTVAGYLSLPVAGPTKTAILLFSAPVAVTTLKVPSVQPIAHNCVHIHFTTIGNLINYTGTGLTSGTFIFYFGTAFLDSLPIERMAAVVASFTTGNPGTFTFPSDTVLTGISAVLGTDTAETLLQYRVNFNTSAGRSITISWSMNDPLEITSLDNVPVAQSLTLTGTTTGTHIATGYVALYYQL